MTAGDGTVQFKDCILRCKRCMSWCKLKVTFEGVKIQGQIHLELGDHENCNRLLEKAVLRRGRRKK